MIGGMQKKKYTNPASGKSFDSYHEYLSDVYKINYGKLHSGKTVLHLPHAMVHPMTVAETIKEIDYQHNLDTFQKDFPPVSTRMDTVVRKKKQFFSDKALAAISKMMANPDVVAGMTTLHFPAPQVFSEILATPRSEWGKKIKAKLSLKTH